VASQSDKAQQFKSLHIAGNPLVLFNVWDAGSAKVVAANGAQAIATGSAPVAMANGFRDGEQFPLEQALVVAERIINAVSLPFGGYRFVFARKPIGSCASGKRCCR